MTILETILAIFAGIADWIVETVGSVTPMFYVAETGLTFLGTLAVAGLAISVAFLLIGIVQRFLKFKA